MTAPTELSAFKRWAQLVRLPNVFTVVADVSAAFVFVAHSVQPVARLVCVVLAAVALYWAGMILNDVFDIDRDREERPERPIPAGHIALATAKLAGWGLLAVGVVMAAVCGFLPSSSDSLVWLPGVVGVLLAVMIVAYDGPLKKTFVAPVAMGWCRFFSFLLGAVAALTLQDGQPLIPKHILMMAAGFGVYVMGVTSMARDEATGGKASTLMTGFIVILVGLGILALSPGVFHPQGPWKLNPNRDFPMLIGLVGLPVVLRGLRAQMEPSPDNVKNTIRAGVLSIIPLAAAVAFLGAGRVPALVIFALLIPAIVLSMRLRVT